LPAKTIFATPVFPVFFSMEKTGYFRLLAKTCQPWFVGVEIGFIEARAVGR